MENPIENKYIAIDLKSFYASVECVERGLNPLTANLVVADESRTDKTICLAVSPSLKAYGTGGRPRLFEVIQRVPRNISFVIAPPRMALYLDYSARIQKIYNKYVAPEDMHVYSVDEVFMDVTHYLATYKMSAHELARTIIRDVLAQTGITATAGIGTNMYLCKVAMDIVAKRMPADEDGVRIAELDERSYRESLWSHTPLTDFWRVGRGTQKRLEQHGIRTMGDIARMSLQSENFLYKLFGINAELLIDHAWGWEPCTMELLKSYHSTTNSLSNGQVLSCAYTATKGKVVAREMAEEMAMRLFSNQLVTDQLVLTVGYDTECLTIPDIADKYKGDIVVNRYGKPVPKHAHGSQKLTQYTFSAHVIVEVIVMLYDRIVNPDLLVRRINITANHVIRETDAVKPKCPKQLDLFVDYEAACKEQEQSDCMLPKERRLMEAVLKMKNRYGKNAILKGVNFDEGATGRDRNAQIGGHKA